MSCENHQELVSAIRRVSDNMGLLCEKMDCFQSTITKIDTIVFGEREIDGKTGLIKRVDANTNYREGFSKGVALCIKTFLVIAVTGISSGGIWVAKKMNEEKEQTLQMKQIVKNGFNPK